MGNLPDAGCAQDEQVSNAPPTPEPVSNPPALAQVSYRTGRYATFLASMQAALADPAAPLAALRTRDPGDFTLALLDAWAVVLDTLTFYSERIANEGFLRTAGEPRSATELAALVGYVPSPGVSATATLAFTLSAVPGAPAEAAIPAGTRVQSVPGPGQVPQVFEASADLTARTAWNALPAQVTAPWSLTGTEQSTWLAGTAVNLSAGDALLFVADDSPGPGRPSAELHRVTAVAPSPATAATQVTWDAPLSSPDFAQGARVYALRTTATLFGASAPASAAPPYTVWGGGQVVLDTSYPGLLPGTPDAPQWLVLTMTTADSAPAPVSYACAFPVSAVRDGNPGQYGLLQRATYLTVGDPLPLAGLAQSPDRVSAAGVLASYLLRTRDVTAYVRSEQLAGAPLPLADWGSGWPQPATPGMLVPVGGAAVLVAGGQGIPPGQPAALTGRRVRLQVAAGGNATFTPAGASDGSPAPDGQVFLLDTVPPTVDAASVVSWSVVTVGGVAGSLTHPATSPWPALLPAAAADPLAGEAVVIRNAAPAGDATTLNLASPLARVYDRSTVTVNANAVLASHGQTVQEILGSGDTTQASLSFTLKQAPLAYLTAPVATGAQSTLQVWVNNHRWQEVADLSTAGPADRVYAVTPDPSGHMVVRFGDGTHGSRPPTGQANIRAVYRAGTGLAGMIAAGQLSQPLDRPQGVLSVSNPSAATGGADPATADEVRASAPALTLDRVVSLQDYQDFALGFAGIARAQAAYRWSGGTRGIFLTVAGAGGAVLTTTDPVLSSLVTALRQAGGGQLPLTLAAPVPVLFTFTAGVVVDTSVYDPAAVLDQAWQAVAAAFAFDGRDLGQPVTASQVTAVLQGVPGVLAVRLSGLMRSGLPATAAEVLRASGPRPPLGAELLLLDPATRGRIGRWS